MARSASASSRPASSGPNGRTRPPTALTSATPRRSSAPSASGGGVAKTGAPPPPPPPATLLRPERPGRVGGEPLGAHAPPGQAGQRLHGVAAVVALARQ